MFTKCPEFLGWMMSSFQSGKAEEILRDVQKKKILVLDDLGAEKMSEWTFSALYRVISHRYDYFLPTIVTSNLTLDAIDQWEPRIASRLAGLTVISLTGTDRRMGLATCKTEVKPINGLGQAEIVKSTPRQGVIYE
jgi:DNA replication protein DnaC